MTGWRPAHEERGGARLLHFQRAHDRLILRVADSQPRARACLSQRGQKPAESLLLSSERPSQAATNDSRMQPELRAGEMRANQSVVTSLRVRAGRGLD